MPLLMTSLISLASTSFRKKPHLFYVRLQRWYRTMHRYKRVCSERIFAHWHTWHTQSYSISISSGDPSFMIDVNVWSPPSAPFAVWVTHVRGIWRSATRMSSSGRLRIRTRTCDILDFCHVLAWHWYQAPAEAETAEHLCVLLSLCGRHGKNLQRKCSLCYESALQCLSENGLQQTQSQIYLTVLVMTIVDIYIRIPPALNFNCRQGLEWFCTAWICMIGLNALQHQRMSVNVQWDVLVALDASRPIMILDVFPK